MEGKVVEKLKVDIKRMVDEVVVPTKKLEQTVEAALVIGRKKKRTSFVRRQNVLASLAAVFILAIGTVLFVPIILDSTNGTNGSESSIFSQAKVGSNEGLQRMAAEGRMKPLNLEAEDQGIKVILEEAYLDNYQLAISYRLEIDNEKAINQEKADISLEWFVDGRSQISHSVGGMDTKDLIEKGSVFTFDNTRDWSSNPQIDLHINLINGVEGDWSFSFNVEKVKEYLTLKSPIIVGDKESDYIAIGRAELTPSMLKLNASTHLTFEEAYPDFSRYDFLILSEGQDGYTYINDWLTRGSNSKGAYEFVTTNISLYETIEIPRMVNHFSYEIIPYIVTYTGVEHPPTEYGSKSWNFDMAKGDFTVGATLDLATPITIKEIKQIENETIVFYEMDFAFPIFPHIEDWENDLYIRPKAYKIHEGFVEVKYPKIEENESIQFLMYEAKYDVLSDYIIELNLN